MAFKKRWKIISVLNQSGKLIIPLPQTDYALSQVDFWNFIEADYNWVHLSLLETDLLQKKGEACV